MQQDRYDTRNRIPAARWALLALLAAGGCGPSGTPSATSLRSALTQAPRLPAQLGDFSVYATEDAYVRDRAAVSGAWVGAGRSIEIGASAKVLTGSVIGRTKVTMREGARVEGDVVSGGQLESQNGTVVTGTVTANAYAPAFTIATRAVTPGTVDKAVYVGQTLTLPAGAYNEVHVYGGTLTLQSGVYSVRRFIVEASGATLKLDVSGGKISVNAAEELRIGDRTRMSMLYGVGAALVDFYSSQQLTVGTDCHVIGTLAAPNGGINVYSRTEIHGALYARTVSVDSDAKVVRDALAWPAPSLFGEPTGQPGFEPYSTGTIFRSRPVNIDVQKLMPPDNHYVTLNLFDDVSLTAVGVRIERNGGGYVWMGQVLDQPGSIVALSVKNAVVSGEVITADRGIFQVRFAGNGVHVVRSADQSSFPEGGEISADVPPAAPDPCGGTDEGRSIDVLMAYTTAVKDALGGTDAALAHVFLSVATTNQAYIDSGISQRLRIVRVTEVAYTEQPKMLTDLNNLDGGKIGDLTTQRDTYGADFITLLIKSPETSYCGYSPVMGTVSTAFESAVGNVVMYDCAVTNFSLAHEDGHIMGARHDRYDDNVDGSPYSYNHGYVNTAKKWRTIMAYNAECKASGLDCTRLGYFSNPNISYNGDPTGIADGQPKAADNHMTLNNTASTVANFRCTSPHTANVWLRDTWDDTGAEPDPKTKDQAMYESPYVWVRNTQDTNKVHQHEHENPVFGADNWIYAKLHNGADKAMSGKLEFYFASASTNLTWPSGWTLIGSVDVNGFAARSSQVVELKWSGLPGSGHYCLLARWVSADDPMKVTEGADIEVNVRNNNNLAWRNVNIIAASPDGADVRFDMKASGGTYALKIAPTEEEQNGSFLLYGTVTVTPDPVVLRAWIAGGMKGSGFRHAIESDHIDITDPAGAVLENIRIPGEGTVPYPIALRVKRPTTTPKRSFHLRATQFYYYEPVPRIADVNPAAPKVASASATPTLVNYWELGGVTYELRP